MSNLDESQVTFENLWSNYNHQRIDNVLIRLKELKLCGQYYDEINMPDVYKIIIGLRNDIDILKKEKIKLINEKNS